MLAELNILNIDSFTIQRIQNIKKISQIPDRSPPPPAIGGGEAPVGPVLCLAGKAMKVQGCVRVRVTTSLDGGTRATGNNDK